MGLHMKIKETERGLWGKEGKARGLWSPSDARAGLGYLFHPHSNPGSSALIFVPVLQMRKVSCEEIKGCS